MFSVKKVEVSLKNLIFDSTVRAPEREALLLLANHAGNHDDIHIDTCER